MNTAPNRFISILERALCVCVLLLALSAPISIAATQTAWAFALLFWLLAIPYRGIDLRRDAFTLVVLGFVALTLLSSIFSYEPQISMRKMVGVSLVSIIFLVKRAIRTGDMLRIVVIVLLVSAAFTSVYVLATTAVGRNMKVHRLAPESPLAAAGVRENDTIISANGLSVNSPGDLETALQSATSDVLLKVYRYEVYLDISLPAASVPSGTEPTGRFGIAEYSRGRDVRAAGFFGHYTTYAEVLQLIASLALGLLLAFPGPLFSRTRIVLAVTLLSLLAALFLTVTRASWGGFAVSAVVALMVTLGRKAVIICLLAAIPAALIGAFYIQQKRNVGVFDANDQSTLWRLVVWREAMGVLASSPRHLAIGVGMDAVKLRWREWGMFDGGKLPTGHMHSTPIALAFERGVPVLILWIAWMALYFRMLWRGIRSGSPGIERGVLVGCFAGTAGFLVGGLVHYNWGDSEVLMVFYLLTGLSLTALDVQGRTKTELRP